MKDDMEWFTEIAMPHEHSPLEPRDLLVHIRVWLETHRELRTRHFGESDMSSHPHGYDGVVIPVWDLRQMLDSIGSSLSLGQRE